MFLRFILIGDIIRLIAVLGLAIKIYQTKSCAGISGKTQILLALVCSTRYLDLFFKFYTFDVSVCDSSIRVAFIVIAFLTVYLIYGRFRETYGQNEDSTGIKWFLFISLLLGVIFNDGYSGGIFTFPELLERGLNVLDILWSFSIFLEVVAIIPQLVMIYHDKIEETRKFIFYYIYALVAYRWFYLLHWVYLNEFQYRNGFIADVAGLVQFVMYCAFACLYMKPQSPYAVTV